jgi:hypothetical protein
MVIFYSDTFLLYFYMGSYQVLKIKGQTVLKLNLTARGAKPLKVK